MSGGGDFSLSLTGSHRCTRQRTRSCPRYRHPNSKRSVLPLPGHPAVAQRVAASRPPPPLPSPSLVASPFAPVRPACGRAQGRTAPAVLCCRRCTNRHLVVDCSLIRPPLSRSSMPKVHGQAPVCQPARAPQGLGLPPRLRHLPQPRPRGRPRGGIRRQDRVRHRRESPRSASSPSACRRASELTQILDRRLQVIRGNSVTSMELTAAR